MASIQVVLSCGGRPKRRSVALIQVPESWWFTKVYPESPGISGRALHVLRLKATENATVFALQLTHRQQRVLRGTTVEGAIEVPWAELMKVFGSVLLGHLKPDSPIFDGKNQSIQWETMIFTIKICLPSKYVYQNSPWFPVDFPNKIQSNEKGHRE